MPPGLFGRDPWGSKFARVGYQLNALDDSVCVGSPAGHKCMSRGSGTTERNQSLLGRSDEVLEEVSLNML